MEIRCIGCGAVIQSEDKLKPGYVPKEVLERGNFERLICQRCHKIKNYNLISKNEMPIEKYYEILKKITKTDSLFIYVVDLFDLDSTLNSDVCDLIKKKDIILVLNKRDLLPKSFKDGKILNWVKNRLKEVDLKVKQIVLTSVKNKYHIDYLREVIETYRKGRNCYALGSTNVGKSSLINALIRSEGMLDYDLITTSLIPATTLSLIEIPLFNDKLLYDTPGLVNRDNILSIVDEKDFKTIMPKVEIKPGVYQLNEEQSLLISGFACLDYLKGGRNSIVTYFANSLPIQRSKLARRKELFPNSIHDLFEVYTENLEYDTYEFEITKPSDIVISGLGFINIKNLPATINLTVLKGVKVLVRDAITL